jgi:hypothetical protein
MSVKNILTFCFAVLLLPAAPLRAADDEDFNWTEASRFVDSFPFPQRFLDSLASAHGVAHPSSPLRVLPPQSFSSGEMLAYDIGWSFVKGGYVILTATPDPARRAIRLGAKALSRGFVSTFYRMRDYALSTVDAEGLYPLFFEEHLREGKRYRADKCFLFDHAGRQLHLRDRTLSMPAFTNDYLSVLYLARTRRFAPGDTFMLPFFVDGKLYRLVFSCVKRETAEFNGKKVRCLVVLPQPADDKGEFNRKKRLELWFSDDEYRLPVRIKAKIAIGSIVADLIYAGRPKGAAPSAAAEKADTLKRQELPAPRLQKSADTSGTAAGPAAAKGPSAGLRDTAAALFQDPLRVAADTIAGPPSPRDEAPADTAAVPSPPVSKTSYETIDVKDAGEARETAPSGGGCRGEPAPHPCSRDNFY